jgi:general secretion pathway protein M
MADQERKMNAATSRAGGMKQSFSTFWNARNKRERNMLAIAAAVVVLGLLYALLIDPALSGRQALERKLPTLRQQSAEVQALAREASSSGVAARANANTPPPPPITRERLEASLSEKGLKAQSLSVTGELARVQLAGVSFASTVEWLTELQRTSSVGVVDAVVEAQAQPDTVNATLSLRQQKAQ